MIKFITNKKTVLLISFIGTVFIACMVFIPSVDYCYSHLWCSKTLDVLGFISFSLLFFPIVLFLSLITYKMRDEVYKYWMEFAGPYILFFIASVYVIPFFLGSSGGGWGGLGMGGLLYLFIYLVLIIVFIVISTKRIIHKHRHLRNH